MRSHSTNGVRRWCYAAKPASWPKLLVPFALGQAMGIVACLEQDRSAPSWLALGAGAGLTIFNLGFLVFLNDVSDWKVDAIKRGMFPHGCSPKTIPDGILPARALETAGWASVLAYLSLAHVTALVLDRPLLPVLAWIALALFAGYSLVPPRLNYRGGGELLEAVGTGMVLPITQIYLQSGAIFCAEQVHLVGWFCFCLASALASGLSDERSDRRGGKVTAATALGNVATRRAIETCTVAACLAWAIGFHLSPGVSIPVWAATAVLAVAVIGVRRVGHASAAARTDEFAALGTYKLELHRAMWSSAGVLCVVLVLLGLQYV